jgi:hypothetical protein
MIAAGNEEDQEVEVAQKNQERAEGTKSGTFPVIRSDRGDDFLH